MFGELAFIFQCFQGRYVILDDLIKRFVDIRDDRLSPEFRVAEKMLMQFTVWGAGCLARTVGARPFEVDFHRTFDCHG